MSNSRFETILCDTEESRNIHYRIRYQVYCRETGFEDSKNFSTGKEKDKYDIHSIHFATHDSTSGQWIAAMRLVLAHEGRVPSESFCNLEPLPKILMKRRRLIEFSRLCVLESYRCHNHDRCLGLKVIDGKSEEVQKTTPGPRYPEILLGFVQATFAWSRENNVRFCYFLINRALARMLQRLNIDLKPVGDSCEHKGVRTPFLVDLRKWEQCMAERLSMYRELARHSTPYLRYSDLSKSALLGRRNRVEGYK